MPIHLILGANDYIKIGSPEKLRVGRIGELVAECTQFGWAVMSPGNDEQVSFGFIAVSSLSDYDNLCA